jgi:acyl-CoA synthetase (AMP-forming)/AMP-acid ligase II
VTELSPTHPPWTRSLYRGLAEAAVGLTFPPPDRGPLTDCIDRNAMMHAGRALPIATDRPDALRFVSCGTPLPGYQVRIVDASGSESPERIEGAVEFTGPSATAGYYRNAGATTRLLKGEWHDTGDRGYMAAGDLRRQDRTAENSRAAHMVAQDRYDLHRAFRATA